MCSTLNYLIIEQTIINYFIFHRSYKVSHQSSPNWLLSDRDWTIARDSPESRGREWRRRETRHLERGGPGLSWCGDIGWGVCHHRAHPSCTRWYLRHISLTTQRGGKVTLNVAILGDNTFLKAFSLLVHSRNFVYFLHVNSIVDGKVYNSFVYCIFYLNCFFILMQLLHVWGEVEYA